MYAFLVLATVLVAVFVAIFAGGALVGLASLGMLALRAGGRTQDVKAEANLSRPVVRPVRVREAAMAETFVDAGAEYAPA